MTSILTVAFRMPVYFLPNCTCNYYLVSFLACSDGSVASL